MINKRLHEFVDRVIDNNRISREDVQCLQREILTEGVSCRAEADALLALDRMLEADPAWGDFLVAAMVDHVVWGSRPTGRVPAETAAWLVTAFTCGEPTPTAIRIAHAIVAEAQEVDPELLLFTRRPVSPSASLAA